MQFNRGKSLIFCCNSKAMHCRLQAKETSMTRLFSLCSASFGIAAKVKWWPMFKRLLCSFRIFDRLICTNHFTVREWFGISHVCVRTCVRQIRFIFSIKCVKRREWTIGHIYAMNTFNGRSVCVKQLVDCNAYEHARGKERQRARERE